LPEQIPSHFNAAGVADNYSPKTRLFILPLVTTLAYAAMTLLNRHPHLYNYLTPVTQENARQMYTTSTRLIRILKLVVVVIFNGIVFMTYRAVFTKTDHIGAWFLPLALALLILPNLLYLGIAFRSKKS
jgi:uncharacterized membrane protein